MLANEVSFLDRAGAQQVVKLDLDVYRRAEAEKLSVPQYINKHYATDADKYGSPFEQFMASCGLFVKRDARYGVKPPSIKDVFEGTGVLRVDGNQSGMQAGTIVREAAPASRILFPVVVIAAVENKLKADTSGYVGMFDSLVSRKETISGYKFDQPVLNFSGPEGARSKPIAQGAVPQSMLTITASEVSRKIPTYSLGLEITREAQEATSLDLVNLALTRQAEVERAAIVDAAIVGMVNGDSDAGYGALTGSLMTAYDAASTTPGAITHKAWMKYLRKNWRKRHIDWVMCDLATAMAIESRTGKPIVTQDNPNSPRIDALMNVMNPMWQGVKIFLLEDGLLPANTVLGIDSRYAMWKVETTSADYTAIEEFVLRKVTSIRFDMGYQYFRQFDEAFEVMTLATS